MSQNDWNEVTKTVGRPFIRLYTGVMQLEIAAQP